MTISFSGAPIPGGARIAINPSRISMGRVLVGQAVTHTVEVVNTGDADCQINDIVLDIPYTLKFPTFPPPHDPIYPVVLAPGDILLVEVTFTPTAAVSYPDDFEVRSSAINSPTIASVTGTGIVIVGSKAISIDPLVWDFGNVKVGTDSAEKQFIITNTGDDDVVISAINYTSPFSSGSTPPSATLPATIAVGDTLTFTAMFTPIAEGFVDLPDGAQVTSDAPAGGNVDDIELKGTGFLIDPGPKVYGTEVKPLFAYCDEAGVVRMRVVDDPTDLDSEERGQLERVTNYGMPGVEKSLQTFFFKYEDLGPATLTLLALTRVVIQNVSYSETVQKTLAIGTSVADGAIISAQAEMLISGELVDFIVYREKNTGPISIVEFLLKFEDWVSLLGTFHLKPITTPVAIVSNAEKLLMAYATNADVVSVLANDHCNWDSEEDCLLVKVSDLGVHLQNKTVMRVIVRYEDYGPAKLVVLVSVKEKNELVVDRTEIAIGTVACDRKLRWAFADLTLKGEVLQLDIVRLKNQGQVVLTEYFVQFDPAGELKAEIVV